ncbi:High-affinity nitrate transporter 3.1 [Sesamum angolense]|uniref:High-affinity nitrate transporter 3.1 n=1 Tax=Sesamum angolense TaxID=2727404 RepID=A0AAE1WZC4_9LAMI|nr:High-affinity nitrate transporter 3.1 [Sesamum angolense]
MIEMDCQPLEIAFFLPHCLEVLEFGKQCTDGFSWVSSCFVLAFVLGGYLLWCYLLFSSGHSYCHCFTSTTPSLKAGEDKITVTWALNTSFPAGIDSAYKTIKVKLCYAPISQQDRAWRKTVDNLKKDKTCQHKIVAKPYSSSNNTFTWTVQRDVPTATYFVRAYAHNSADEEVAYGQTTDSHKSTNLFEVQAISGRHMSLDVASVCFSAFSIVSCSGSSTWKEKGQGIPNKVM